jgi:hypothetical protein
MKRQNFDASLYTTYLKKRANTMLLESNNFEKAKSIVSTPPSAQDTLSVALRSEFEKIVYIPEPVGPSVVTIIDDIPINNQQPALGGDLYFGGSSITITWTCIPSSEVTIELYGARLDMFTGFPIGAIESHTVRETIVTSNTSHIFDFTPYFYESVALSVGTSMYVVITPSNGLSVQGHIVSMIGFF